MGLPCLKESTLFLNAIRQKELAQTAVSVRVPVFPQVNALIIDMFLTFSPGYSHAVFGDS